MKKSNWVAMLPFYLLALIFCVGLAGWGSGAVTAAVQNQPITREHIIVIDAGHGGIDGGATSCTGILESAFNLQIALRLNDLLHLLGFDTVMIRRTDTSVYTEGSTIAAQKVSDLKERVRLVNETENGILVSIHQNTFSDSRYSGPQVFYGNDVQGKALAEILQGKLNGTLSPGSDRVCKKADSVYLLQNIERPGVLVECGFISNPGEEAKLRDVAYQQKLCAVIASGLTEYFFSGG